METETTNEVAATEVAPRPPPRGGPLRVIVRALLGVVVGLVLVELGAYALDRGAFPHLNVYEADDALGARLRPGATQRFRFHTNPVTDIRINSAGFRGPELEAPSRDEVVFIGDSQVFGLGVEESETFVAQVAGSLARPVVNAGIPTHGPIEFEQTAERLLETRSPGVVVYVVNMVNDLFEVGRPNRERHGVWDGWAVRIETMPTRILEFPGRDWLYGRSHAFYALRRLLHVEDAAIREQGFASEGDHSALVTLGTEELAARLEDEARAERVAAETRAALDAEGQAIELRIEEGTWSLGARTMDAEGSEFQLLQAGARGQPGDIVTVFGEESSRSVRITAEHVRRGVALRAALERSARRAAYRSGDQRLARDFERRDALVAEQRALSSAPAEVVATWTPIYPHLRRMRDLCERHGARLVVLVLPIDVQVSESEWAKYGAEPIDMSGTRVLNEDVVRAAASLGVDAIDATSALEGAEPGAFLHADIHLSPRGHRVVAEALAATIRAEPPPRLPREGLPLGRSLVPTPSEFRLASQVGDLRLLEAGCDALQVREWLRVRCRTRDGVVPAEFALTPGDAPEAMTLATQESVTLLMPLVRGAAPHALELRTSGGTRRIDIAWPEGADAPTVRAGATLGPPTTIQLTERALRACACHAEHERALYGRSGGGCSELYGRLHEACFVTYASDCGALVACLRGDPSSPPTCSEGEVRAGAAGHCARPCDAAHPCAPGSLCTDWNGGRLCL